MSLFTELRIEAGSRVLFFATQTLGSILQNRTRLPAFRESAPSCGCQKVQETARKPAKSAILWVQLDDTPTVLSHLLLRQQQRPSKKQNASATLARLPVHLKPNSHRPAGQGGEAAAAPSRPEGVTARA
jgi:hypothetical protein